MGRKGGKKHLKKLVAPRTWPLERKDFVWTSKQKPGKHRQELSLPLIVLVRNVLKKVDSKSKAIKMIKNGEIMIDGKIIKDRKFSVGFMDVVAIPKTTEFFRVVFDEKGYIRPCQIKEEDANFKLCKIEGKKDIKGGKTQLNLHDGRCLLEKEKYANGDVLKISLPDQKILEHFPFEAGGTVCVIKGKHIGKTGRIKEKLPGTITRPSLVKIETSSGEIAIPSECIFIIGKEKPVI
jgi:small subunit ribosomal protein S4e